MSTPDTTAPTLEIVQDPDQPTGHWRAFLVPPKGEPRLVARVKQLADGRLIVVPIGRTATALRANLAEARAYLEPLVLTPPAAPDPSPASTPDLFPL